MISNQEPKPGRIQVCARPNNPISGKPRQFPRNVSQDVYWIRHYHQNSLRGAG
ncbi:hypothetical protein HanRHA438_Chr06g0247921 [Helianthus annuus]|nr:hypothetical protein HanRHA438_Chr06g0247921 [Helianthus annuus]